MKIYTTQKYVFRYWKYAYHNGDFKCSSKVIESVWRWRYLLIWIPFGAPDTKLQTCPADTKHILNNNIIGWGIGRIYKGNITIEANAAQRIPKLLRIRRQLIWLSLNQNPMMKRIEKLFISWNLTKQKRTSWTCMF